VGYVAKLTSSGDGSALWAGIVWIVAAQPIYGNIYPKGRFRRLNFESNNVLVAPTSWNSPLSCARYSPTVDHTRL
jgi:hypothetical protein